MQVLSVFVKTIALITIFCAVLSALVPEGRMKGAFGFLCGVFLIAAALQGLPGREVISSMLHGLFQSDQIQQSSLEEAQRHPALWAAQAALETELREALSAQGLPYTIAAALDQKDETTVDVHVTVSGAGTKEQQSKAKTLLSQMLPPDADVLWKTEETP